MSQMSQSWKPRLRASRLACASGSRVSVATVTSCGVSRCGIEVVGTFMAMLRDLLLVRPPAIPERELHRPEPQRAQQFGNRGEHLCRRQGIALLADNRREGALLAVGL